MSDDTMRCHECGSEYARVTMHWRKSSCPYPSLSDRQVALIEGAVAGDGHLTDGNGAADTSGLVLSSTSTQFLQWFDSQFPSLSFGYRETKSAAEQAEAAGAGGGNTVTADDCSPLYKLYLGSHPKLGDLREKWYSAGEKAFTESFESHTSVAARVWYAGDGFIQWKSREGPDVPRVCFGSAVDVTGATEDFPFTVSYYSEADRAIVGSDRPHEVLSWLGPPVPGYEYKWSVDSHTEYDEAIATS